MARTYYLDAKGHAPQAFLTPFDAMSAALDTTGEAQIYTQQNFAPKAELLRRDADGVRS